MSLTSNCETSNCEAKIKIDGLKLRTFIGIKEDEILNKQDVVINMSIHYDASSAINTNQIETALNYRTITKEIIQFVEQNRFSLLEKMTHDVLMIILSYPQVNYASVQIDKPYALRFSKSVSVTLSASK